MAYNGILLSDEEQKRYAGNGGSKEALRPNNYIMKNFAFQGPEEEILRLLAFVEEKFYRRLQIYKTEEGFARVCTTICDHRLICEFPILKATGFLLETDDTGKIIQAGVGYKESGYGYLTDYKRIVQYFADIGPATYQNTSSSYCWPLLRSPLTKFTVRYVPYDPATMPKYDKKAKKIELSYEFPYEFDWNDRKYIFWKDGAFYQFDTEINYRIEDRTLISYRGSKKRIGVPSNVDVIGPEAFKGNTEVVSINLPGLNEIGAGAFEGCSNLKFITFKKTLKKIGEDAFAGCEKLTELEIPDMVHEIGDGAFMRCGVEKVTWPKGTKEIPTGMFRDCRNLYEIVIPPEVEKIGRRVFCRDNTVIVYGQPGSVAEEYAKNNGMYFKPMDFSTNS